MNLRVLRAVLKMMTAVGISGVAHATAPHQECTLKLDLMVIVQPSAVDSGAALAASINYVFDIRSANGMGEPVEWVALKAQTTRTDGLVEFTSSFMQSISSLLVERELKSASITYWLVSPKTGLSILAKEVHYASPASGTLACTQFAD